jgi:hypothetical protein
MENFAEGLTLETLPKAFAHLMNEVTQNSHYIGKKEKQIILT